MAVIVIWYAMINELRKKQQYYCLKRRRTTYKALGQHKSKWLTPSFCRCRLCINPRKRHELTRNELIANIAFKEYLNDL